MVNLVDSNHHHGITTRMVGAILQTIKTKVIELTNRTTNVVLCLTIVIRVTLLMEEIRGTILTGAIIIITDLGAKVKIVYKGVLFVG